MTRFLQKANTSSYLKNVKLYFKYVMYTSQLLSRV